MKDVGQVEPMPLVLVHGLWSGPWSMRPLQWRLRRAGFETRQFAYSATGVALDRNAQALAAMLESSAESQVAIVAHSFGGLVALEAARLVPQLSGNMVLLGVPIGGSVVARRLAARPGGRRLLGQALPALQQPTPVPDGARWSVAMIAGSRRMGLGFVAGGWRWPSDGTVLVKETEAEGLADYWCVNQTHTSLLVSSTIAKAVVNFLRCGRLGQ